MGLPTRHGPSGPRAGGLLATLLVAAACMNPPPGASPVATPTGTQPGAILQVGGIVRDGCGAIGGCAYVARLEGRGGAWEARFDIGPGAHGSGDRRLSLAPGLLSSLPPGDYALRLTTVAVSDEVGPGGTRELGPVLATCSAFFTVDATTLGVTADGTFLAAACTIAIARR